MRVEALQLGLECRIVPGVVIGLLELEDQRHQRLGHEAPAEQAEEAVLVRPHAIAVGPGGGSRSDVGTHAVSLLISDAAGCSPLPDAPLAAAMKRRISRRSF